MKKILVEHLKYKYPMTDRLALDDISFEVKQGEKIGIIGQNGAGKSTLCQALVGLVPHFYKGGYGGKVLVDGIEVKESSVGEVALKVGMVFQNPFTQVTGAKLTVYEEVAFGLENMGLPREEMIERVDQTLKLMNIYQYRKQDPFSLSGGQMQRMAIAGILAMQPNIIVLDEPTSQLDPRGRAEVFETLDALSSRGKTIILVEHEIEKIAQYCDKVLVLKEGKKLAFDRPSVIFSEDNLKELGINAPVYTNVCKALNKKAKDSKTKDFKTKGHKTNDIYPVTLAEATAVLGVVK